MKGMQCYTSGVGVSNFAETRESVGSRLWMCLASEMIVELRFASCESRYGRH